MVERINKDAFIANILECFTLLQTYEECYKEILDIIDVINGLNESDLTVENLQKLVEGSEYISLDLNQAGTKLVISLDRTHVDETVKEDSTNLVTSGAVFDAVANANGNVLRLPINVPTEPLVVMIGTNNAQTNMPLGDGLAVVNNHLVATGGGGGGGISPSEANTFTAKQTFSGGIVSTKPATADDELTTLSQMKNSNIGNQQYTDTKFKALNDQLVATNTEVAKKLDKMTGTGSGVKAYVNQDGTDRLLNATSDKTRKLLVMWDNLAQLHANAGTTDDAVVNKKQMDEQDAKLQQSINDTDSQVQKLNEDITTIKTDTIPGLNNQLVATNTEVAKKLDKMTGTGSGVKAYVNQDGTDRLLNATSDKTRKLLVMWDNLAQLHANAGTTDDAVVNKKQMDEQDAKLQQSINATDSQVQALNEEVDTIKTDTIPAINATIAGLGKVVKITQTDYDALTPKDDNTLYVIVG